MNHRPYQNPNDALIAAVASADATHAARRPSTGPTVEQGTAVYCFLTQLFTGATQAVVHVS